jgi:hypothetical protein
MTEVGSIGGLRIESDFALHDLAGAAVCELELGRVVVRRVSAGELARRASMDPAAIALDPGQPGSFLVTRADEVLVAPSAGAADRSILSFLFGPCFGAIAYLNGVLPLHASAIVSGDGCVGFTGQSGAGKSTMVAALSLRGHLVHSDDVCMLRIMPDGELLAWPGIRWVRLTDETVRALDYVPDLPRPTGRKHTLLLKPLPVPATPRILRAMYVLEESAAGEPASIAQLRGARAAERIISNVYRPQLAHHVDVWPTVVASCVAVADSVPVYLFRRPLDFSQLADSLDVLEAHLPRADGQAPV